MLSRLVRLILHWLSLTVVLGFCLSACQASKSKTDILIAVATNFNNAAEDLSADFQSQYPYKAALSPGSTGKLYAQIKAGAPYDIFLSADQLRPDLLTEDGTAIAGTQLTYALGQLALYGRKTSADDITLNGENYNHLAIANPDLAPYGQASIELLKTLDIYESAKNKIVMGENVGQVFALVETGHADYGLIARSSFAGIDTRPFWAVPTHLHSPIRQDSVQLTDSPAASAFMAYLKSKSARDIIRAHGYSLPDG